MIHMLMVILPDAGRSEKVMEAWIDAGVGGVTIIDSAGTSRSSQGGLTDDMPLIPTLAALLERGKVNHLTLFTVVDDDALLERAIAVATKEAGGFDSPEHGIMLAIPVARAWGLREK